MFSITRVMKQSILSLLVLFFLLPAYAGEIFGELIDEGYDTYGLRTSDGTLYPLLYQNQKYKTSLWSLKDKKATVVFPEASLTPGGILVDRAPRLSTGEWRVSGTISKIGTDYYLNQKLVHFREGKEIDGTKFDELSQDHFVGKKVITRGNVVNGVYTITSIVEADLFSALSETRHLDKKYIQKELPKFKNSSSLNSFRTTLFANKEKVKPGDSVMIFTMSGHQGDDPKSANGHLATGLATVEADYSLKGEVYNVYIPPNNRKEIISGSNEWLDYFGHIVGGQNNYRPTYTLLLYGVDPQRLLEVREMLELYHAHFRTTLNEFSISVNCGTLTVQALGKVGIYGEHRIDQNGSEKFPVIPDVYSRPIKLSYPKQISYAFKIPMAEYMPRNIFNSFFNNIDYLMKNEKLGAKRMDFVFYGQTPSHRRRGGIATDDVKDVLAAMILRKKALKLIH